MTIQDKIAALVDHYGKAEAARKIGVEYLTLHRWISQGRKPSRHVEPLIAKAYSQMGK